MSILILSLTQLRNKFIMKLKSVTWEMDHNKALAHDFVRDQIQYRFRIEVRNRVYVKVQEFVRYQFHEYVDKQIKDDIRET